MITSVYGLLPKYLTFAPLSTLCESKGVQTGPFGSQLHQEDYVTTGTPIITVEHLGDNRIMGKFKQTTQKSHRNLTNPLFYNG